jgi:hypothetical protein
VSICKGLRMIDGRGRVASSVNVMERVLQHHRHCHWMCCIVSVRTVSIISDQMKKQPHTSESIISLNSPLSHALSIDAIIHSFLCLFIIVIMMIN